MRRRASIALAAAVAAFCAALGGARAAHAEAEFEFYGLRFGTPRQEIAKTRTLIEGAAGSVQVKDPGHGMSSLTLLFDREDVLMEIQALYLRSDDALEIEGLRRALREKFLLPAQAAFKDLVVNLDEYGNRAGFTLSFLSRDIRERSIEHYKREYLSKMK